VAWTLTGACGRLGYDTVTPPAPGVVIDPGQLIELTPDAPLLTAPLSTSDDCGRFLVGIQHLQLQGEVWHPSAVTIGSRVYFTMPCKYGDPGGWDLGLARVDLGGSNYSGAGVWIDGKPATNGVNEFVNHNDVDSLGQSFQSVGFLALGSDGQSLLGVGSNYTTNAFTMMPVHLNVPEDLGPSSYDSSRRGLFDLNANDATWQGATAFDRAILFLNGAYQLFTVHYDAPAMTKNFLAVHRTVNGTDVEFAAAPLREQLAYPVVTTDGAHIYLVAVDENAGQYVLVVADTIDALGTAPALTLNLARFQGAPGSWNYEKYAFTPSGEPQVIGATVWMGELLLFYWAGTGEYTAGTAPYASPRSLGVIAAPLH
jgi:hypothetical protein